jgi:hypothetical protein
MVPRNRQFAPSRRRPQRAPGEALCDAEDSCYQPGRSYGRQVPRSLGTNEDATTREGIVHWQLSENRSLPVIGK